MIEILLHVSFVFLIYRLGHTRGQIAQYKNAQNHWKDVVESYQNSLKYKEETIECQKQTITLLSESLAEIAEEDDRPRRILYEPSPN